MQCNILNFWVQGQCENKNEIIFVTLGKNIHCDPSFGGEMIYNLMSFSTVFQSYKDDERVIMKGCMQCNPVYCRKDFCLQKESNY